MFHTHTHTVFLSFPHGSTTSTVTCFRLETQGSGLMPDFTNCPKHDGTRHHLVIWCYMGCCDTTASREQCQIRQGQASVDARRIHFTWFKRSCLAYFWCWGLRKVCPGEAFQVPWLRCLCSSLWWHVGGIGSGLFPATLQSTGAGDFNALLYHFWWNWMISQYAVKRWHQLCHL